MRSRTSPIWLKPKEELQLVMNNSNSIVDVLLTLGLNPYSGNHKTLNERIKTEQLDTTELQNNRKKASKTQLSSCRKLPSNIDLFKKNTTVTGSTLKRRIIKDSLKEYKCDCGNTGQWLGKKLSLQLDHIDGDNKNNQLDNLRFLCPNCHAQTITYSGKNSNHKKITHNCLDCGTKITNQSKSKLCRFCVKKTLRKVKREDLTIVAQHIKTIGYEATGRMYGVSGNTIKKWFK